MKEEKDIDYDYEVEQIEDKKNRDYYDAEQMKRPRGNFTSYKCDICGKFIKKGQEIEEVCFDEYGSDEHYVYCHKCHKT